jgi:hypothetical protein
MGNYLQLIKTVLKVDCKMDSPELSQISLYGMLILWTVKKIKHQEEERWRPPEEMMI